jgi:uncharacterized protein
MVTVRAMSRLTGRPAPVRRNPREPAPLVCLAATVGWTWLFLGLAVASGRFWLSFPTVSLTVAGFVGPVVVTSAFVASGRWHEALGTFWKRCLDPRGPSLRWYLLGTALPVVSLVTATLLTPGASIRLSPGPIAFLVVGVVAGAAEEPAWRGYGQEGLQRRMSVLAASLVVGVFWALWHLPMFLIPGTYHHGLGVGGTAFWVFNAALVVASPIYAWLYVASGRMVFSVVWFHSVGNLVNELLDAGAGELTMLVVTATVALVVVAGNWPVMRRSMARAP